MHTVITVGLQQPQRAPRHRHQLPLPLPLSVGWPCTPTTATMVLQQAIIAGRDACVMTSWTLHCLFHPLATAPFWESLAVNCQVGISVWL